MPEVAHVRGCAHQKKKERSQLANAPQEFLSYGSLFNTVHHLLHLALDQDQDDACRDWDDGEDQEEDAHSLRFHDRINVATGLAGSCVRDEVRNEP